MVKTIGNPLSWTAQRIGGAAGHLERSVESLGGEAPDDVHVRRLYMEDLREALQKGLADFAAARADVMFVVLLYPVIGLVLMGFAMNLALLPLLFPLVAGFALVGPLAAVGLYEISRRRELGEPVRWAAALGVIAAPRFGAIVVLGLYLVALFLLWLMAASWIYSVTLGPAPPVSASAFLRDVLTTGAGWTMIVVGTAIGFGFALLVLAMSVVSFPMLLDRNVGVPTAVTTSVRVFRKNPRVILAWGLIVVAGLVLGSLPAFVGLMLVLPVLGHATWHLYRQAVA
jgi:uncharacterized membrane protein